MDEGKVSEVDIMFLFPPPLAELNFPAKKKQKTNLIFGYWKTNNWVKESILHSRQTNEITSVAVLSLRYHYTNRDAKKVSRKN